MNRSSRAATVDGSLATPAFLLCFVGNFVQCLAFNLYLHLPGFLQRIGADEVMIGFIAGLTAATAIVSRPLVGRGMDSNGRRFVILVGGILNVIVLCLYLTVTTIGPWVFVVRILHGLAESMLFSGFFTYAADIVPASRRTEGIALFGVSAMLPISLGGLLGDWILRWGNFEYLFVVSIAFAVVSLVLSVPLQDRRPSLASGVRSRGFVATTFQPDLLPLWFVGTIFATAATSVFVFLKTFVMESGIGSVGLFFTAYAIAAVSLRLRLGWLPDRYGPKRLLYPSLGVMALGLALIPLAEGSRLLVVAGVLSGLGHGFAFPILSGLVVTRAREVERGAAMAIFTALFDAGVLVGGPLLGFLIQLGGYALMYFSAAGMLVAGTVIFLFWDRARSLG